MRLEQAARVDAGVVGLHGVGVCAVFDAAKQGAGCGVVFDHDGGAGAAVVVHHHVHLAAGQQVVQRVLAVVFGVMLALVGVAGLEQVNVVQHGARSGPATA